MRRGTTPRRMTHDGPVTIIHLPAAARVAQPWRNGGGVTREIASEPDGSGDFRWRISLADVSQDGPFSAFPGHQRVLTVVRGEGMDLIVDGTSHTVVALRPFAFPGAAAVDCRLPQGPVTALNVIAALSAEVEVRKPTGSVEFEAACTLAIVVVQGIISVRGQRLTPLDALLTSDERSVTIDLDEREQPVLAVIRLGSPAR